jgi:hypothetical protein
MPPALASTDPRPVFTPSPRRNYPREKGIPPRLGGKIMAVQITKKITGYSVVTHHNQEGEPAATAATEAAPAITQAPAPATVHVEPLAPNAQEIVQMHENIERPDVLIGATYKIKSPLFEHALYLTLNDVVLNPGTAFEARRPFEVFINSKNMEQFQWVVALTRVMSAVFRKGGDVAFLVEELKAVFDPRGGYFKPGGVYMPSIVAELGHAIEEHLQMIGVLKTPELTEAQRALIAEKRAAYETANGANIGGQSAGQDHANEAEPGSAGKFPAGAALCNKCNAKALVRLDNCDTCLSCGYSKCG